MACVTAIHLSHPWEQSKQLTFFTSLFAVDLKAGIPFSNNFYGSSVCPGQRLRST